MNEISADLLPDASEISRATPRRWAMLHDIAGLTRPARILDIGANPLEVPVYRPLFDAGLCEIYGFEPQEEAYARLMSERVPGEHYVKAAVGDGSTAQFKCYASSGLSSIFPIDFRTIDLLGRSKRAARLVSEADLKTTRLDDLTDLPRPDLLKIDVQGAETMIIESGKEKLSALTTVITELRFFELYEGEGTLDDQIRVLRSRGFRMHKILSTKRSPMHSSRSTRLRTRRVRNQLIDGDAVFLRDLRDAGSMSNESLGIMALLADAVFESYDVALHCLDLLAARGRLADDRIEAYFSRLPAEIRK